MKTFAAALASFLLAVASSRAQEERRSDGTEGFPSFQSDAPRPLDRGPGRISSNNLFHAMFGFLPLESARTLEKWRVDVGLYEDVSTGGLDSVDDEYYVHYDATLVETNFDFRVGLPAEFEARIGFDLSNLLQDEGKIILERNPGVYLVEPGSRDFGTGDLRFSLKRPLFSYGSKESSGALGLVAGIKIPIPTDRENLLTSGGLDFAAAVLYTQELGKFAFHVNLGLLVPGEAEVFGDSVETRPAFTFGASVVWQFKEWGLAFLQVQGNQSVFEDSFDSVRVLADWVVTLHAGGRFRLGSCFLEPSVGVGLGDRSSSIVATFGFVVPFGGTP